MHNSQPSRGGGGTNIWEDWRHRGGERGPWAGAADDSLLQPAPILTICLDAVQPVPRLFLASVALPYVATWGRRRSRARVVFGWSSAQGSPNLTSPLLPSPSVSFTFVILTPIDYHQQYLDNLVSTRMPMCTSFCCLYMSPPVHPVSSPSSSTPPSSTPPPPTPIKVITGTWGLVSKQLLLASIQTYSLSPIPVPRPRAGIHNIS